MKKRIIAILFIVVVLVGFVAFRYSQQTGSVRLATPGVTVGLRGLHGVFWKNLQVGPSTDPVKTHVGKYLALQGNLAKNADGDRWLASFYGAQDVSSRITVNKDQTSVLTIGPPLNVKTDVELMGREVSIGLSISGQSGERYNPQMTKNGRALDAPGLKIMDETGKLLASGKFKYG